MPSLDRYRTNVKVAVNCPVCRDSVRTVEYAYTHSEQRLFFFRCDICTFLFVRPVIIDELEERQMDGLSGAELHNNSLLKKLYTELFLKREINRVIRIAGRENLRLLDVGCGTGWMTRLYADHGFQAVGLEPSSNRARVAEQTYGLTVVKNYLEKVEFSENFDVVVMRHVLEHFSEPMSAVGKARDLLPNKGLLLLTVPNIDCLGRFLFETAWSWALPHHCNFFNPKSLRTLLNNQGFEVLRMSQSPSPFYFPNSFSRKFPHQIIAKFITKHRVLSMLIFLPFALLGCLMGKGDNLNVIAQRKE